jgi:glycosyltransferase involved in cell wall biosynthesis
VISVITPVYNGERFIESCIQAVINQRSAPTEHLIEHLIIDGGSSDRTVAIIQQYAAQYPHIRWVSERDRGQSDAMNKGIAMAKGNIIAMLNVDDYYEPQVLDRVLERFQTLKVPSLLVGNCNVWDDDGSLGGINKPRKLRFQDLLLGMDINPFPINPSAYFYHKALHQVIGPYGVEEHYAMDIDFLLKAVQHATVDYVDETWGNYRRIAGTKTVGDCANGGNQPRLRRVMRTYRQQLPWPQRLRVAVIFELFRIGQRCQYFLQHPQEIFPKLKAKLTV